MAARKTRKRQKSNGWTEGWQLGGFVAGAIAGLVTSLLVAACRGVQAVFQVCRCLLVAGSQRAAAGPPRATPVTRRNDRMSANSGDCPPGVIADAEHALVRLGHSPRDSTNRVHQVLESVSGPFPDVGSVLREVYRR